MRSLTLALAFGLVAATAQAAQPAVKVLQAWSRPAAAGQTGAGFMVLANPGPGADALVSVKTPLAREVMIHQSTVSGGMASMRMVSQVDVPAGGEVRFAPGGYHLMLVGLTRALKVGDQVPATLTFASGRTVTASFVVRIAPPADAATRP